MNKLTTIQIEKSVVGSLKELRDYPKQSYNDLLKKLLKIYKNIKERNQYDEFLHKVQQQKMQQLWDNEADEDWKNA